MDVEPSDMARTLLRGEMIKRGMTYEALSARLAAMGLAEDAGNIRARVRRGRFSAVFLLQALQAMEIEFIRVPALRAAA